MEDPPKSDGKILKEYQKTNYRADDPETTQWKDIFDKKFTGYIDNDYYEEKVANENESQKKAVQFTHVIKQMKKEEEASSSEEVSGFSDLDAEETQMVELLKAKRLQKQAEYNELTKFGKLSEINQHSYKDAVKTTGFVIVHISSDHLPQCKLVNKALTILSQKFDTVKFVKIDFKQASKDYPENLCPTLLIYSNGTISDKLVGGAEVGINPNTDTLEWKLAQFGVVETDLTEEPTAEKVARVMLKGDIL